MNPPADFNVDHLAAVDIHQSHLAALRQASAHRPGPAISRQMWRALCWGAVGLFLGGWVLNSIF